MDDHEEVLKKENEEQSAAEKALMEAVESFRTLATSRQKNKDECSKED